MRYVTNRLQDPFYKESRMMREQAHKYAVDILQPGMPGFNHHYPNALKNYYEQKKQEEESDWSQWRQRMISRDEMRRRSRERASVTI